MADSVRSRRNDGTVNIVCILWRQVKFIKVYWRSLVLILTPIFCAAVFVFLGTDKKFRCMYVILVMAVYWMTQPIPLAVTSLIPIVAFPVLGILDTGHTTKQYFADSVVMCIGAVMFAVAIESCNLHNRIALKVLLTAGPSHRKLLLGLSIVTSLTSMWVPNTAAVLMVSPIVETILTELEHSAGQKAYTNKTMKEVTEFSTLELEHPIPTNTTVCYYLTIAYAATLGGNGTLVGTGTNLSLKGIYEKYPEAYLGFPEFMAFGVPLMLLTSALTYIWMMTWFMGMFRPKSKLTQSLRIEERARETLANSLKVKYEEMGNISWQEYVVIVLFFAMLCLVLLRNPYFLEGYVKWFNSDLGDYKKQNKYYKSATPMILIVILLFVFPRTLDCFKYCKNVPLSELPTTMHAVMSWPYLQVKTSWGLIFLIGSGYALAHGGEETGMSAYLADKLRFLENLSPLGMMFVMIVFSNMITELGSNVAVANIILPIISSLGREVEIHPLYLLLPAGISCSYSFMLPMGTPTNAVVQELGHVPTNKMIVAGIVPSLITISVTFLLSVYLSPLLWPEINTFPSWAAANATAAQSH